MEYFIAFWQLIVDNAAHLVGFSLPIIVEVLNKDVEGTRERFAVTIVSCVLAAALLQWHELVYGSPEELFTSIGIIFAESQIVFKLYFQDSFLRWKIQQKLGVEHQGDFG